MPHFIIEYPDGLLEPQHILLLIDAVHDAANSTGLFDEAHIKTRAIPMRYYRVGNNRDHFIHVQLRIHNGRTETQKKALSHVVLKAISHLKLKVDIITVEVVDMDKATYAKSICDK